MSYDCILPKGDTDLEEITAKDGVTQVFILSFQVFESSKIKCYWYRRSQMSRFFPKDIVSLWSMYFDQITDEKDMDKIKKDVGRKQFVDKMFEIFYQPLDLRKCELTQ
eukprot:174214_1